MNAKPVSTAEAGAEAGFGNAISTVSAPFMPVTMLMRPVARTMILPDVMPVIPLFVPIDRVLLLVPVAVTMFAIVFFVSFISLLMPVTVLLMFSRTALLRSMLGMRGTSGSQKQAQDGCAENFG